MDRKVALCCLIPLWTSLALCSAAQSPEGPLVAKGYIHEEVFPNGLTLLVKENHSAPIVQANVYIKAGAIHEGEYIGHGISHHIEHIVSGGSTRKRTEAEYEEITSLLGGDCNAWTSRDHTCYYISSTAENLPLILEVLSEWVFECEFAEEEFEREHGVIEREIELGMEEPQGRLWQLTMGAMFKVHPAGYPTIGYLDNFLRLKREDLLRYYDRWYVPENTVVIVVGDVETDSVIAHAKETFGTYARRSPPTFTLPEEPPQVATRVAEEEMDVRIASLRLAYRTIPVTHPDLYPLDLLSYILTRGESAILVKKIRDELGLVSDISSYSATPGYDGGHFAVTAQLDPEKLAETEEAVLEVLETLKESKIEKSLLEKAKKQKITGYVFENQSIADQVRNIGWNYLSAYDKDFYARYVEKIQEVTAEDIQRVLNHYFSTDNLTIARIVPVGHLASSRKSVQTVVPGGVEKTVLENGMILLTKADGSTPLVTMLAVCQGGVRCETDENNGISNFMAQMLLKGTEDLSADEISEKIDNMGIDVSAGGGNNSFYAGFNLVSSDFDEALSLFAKIIQEPQFSPEETERMRNRLITEVGRHEGEWFYEASQFFRETFFIDHPYRRLQQGTRESLTNITREELIDFHDRFCRPDNMVIAVFGDIEALGVKEKVSSAFSDHRRVTPLNMPVNQAEPELIESKRATKYTKKEMAVIYLGYPGMTIDNLEDRYPMEVLDAVVSGVRYGRGSWLHETLRGNELVYVVHAVNWLGLDPGYFFIYAATTPEKMDQAIELILEQIDRVKREDIPDDEFELAKGMCITIEKLDHQSNYEQAFRAALDELYGLGYDHHQRHDAEIRAVTEDDVKRVANKYLNNYVLVTTIPGEDPEGGE